MQVITAAEAAQLVRSGDAVVVSGSGGGHAIPEAILEQIERRFLAEAAPRDLCLIHVVGLGNRAEKGAARFAHPGMLKRSITSALVDSPPLIDLALEDRIESYTLPQGVLSQLMRDMAAGRPGLITKTGLHTFVDPRQLGGRQSPSAREDLVELLEIGGEEWLRFKPFPIDVALLRGTTADEDGNVTMEDEAILGEMLSTAQAARRQGGIVVVQVKRLAQRGTLAPKAVKIPGILVDYVVVDPGQRQTYATDYSPSYAGELRVPLDALKPLPFGPRKVIARRAAMELRAGGDLQPRRRHLDRHLRGGGGGADARPGRADQRAGLHRRRAGHRSRFRRRAELRGGDRPALPVRFLRRRRPRPRVPVLRRGRSDRQRQHQPLRQHHRRHRRLRQHQPERASTVVFSGTFTAGGLEIVCEDGGLRIVTEGRHAKFVRQIEQICYNARFAESEGRQALFVTERAVLRAVDGTLELIEIAPGIDLERDVLAHMAFRPRIASPLRLMNRRLFMPGPMGLVRDFVARDPLPRRRARRA